MQCNPTDILIFAENKVPTEKPRSRVSVLVVVVDPVIELDLDKLRSFLIFAG